MALRPGVLFCLLGLVIGTEACSGEGGNTNGGSPLAPAPPSGGGISNSSASTSAWRSSKAGVLAPIYAIWGTQANDIWAVGGDDNILHWDGSAWTTALSGTSGDLYGVWGTSSTDVWAVGEQGRALHWDGSQWGDKTAPKAGTLNSALFPPSLGAVWGSAPNDVWAVGPGRDQTSKGRISHWDGSQWTDYTVASNASNSDLPYLKAIWGSRADDVWAVGEDGSNGTILHWNGAAWSVALQGSPTLALFELSGIWGSSPNDVWAVGQKNVAHWDGASWKVDACLLVTTAYSGESGTSCVTNINVVWGSSLNDVWAAGSAVQHWNGTSWSADTSPLSVGPIFDTYGIWGSSSNDIWITGPSLEGAVFVHYHP